MNRFVEYRIDCLDWIILYQEVMSNGKQYDWCVKSDDEPDEATLAFCDKLAEEALSRTKARLSGE